MGSFRKVGSLVPEATEDDTFGQHACRAMRQISQMGYKKWLETELSTPSWDDPDWCRMVLALSQDRYADLPSREDVSFRCPKCQDTGLVRKPTFYRGDSAYQVTEFCSPCNWRLWAKAEWKKRQSYEQGSRAGRLDDLLD